MKNIKEKAVEIAMIVGVAFLAAYIAIGIATIIGIYP